MKVFTACFIIIRLFETGVIGGEGFICYIPVESAGAFWLLAKEHSDILFFNEGRIMYKKLLFLMFVALVLGLAGNASAYEPNLIAWWPFDSDYNCPVDPCWNGEPVGGYGIGFTHEPNEYKVGAGALKIDSNTSMIPRYVDTPIPPATLSIVGPHPVTRTVVTWYKYEDISGDGSTDKNWVFETAPDTYAISFAVQF